MTRDVKYALRRLLHNPGFSLVVVMTLALGIGANTAIFSIVNGVLLRPLPYDQPDRLVTLNHFYPNLDDLEAGFAVPTYRDIRERMKIFDAFAVAQGWNANLTGLGQPERLIASKATAEFFKVYGVQPRLGRTFAPGEDHAGRDKVVVLSHGFWQRRFGGDASVIGRKILLDGEPYDVIGVMPVSFYSFFSRTTDLWAPAVFTPEQFGDDRRTNEFLVAAGRLKPGIGIVQAKRDVTSFAAGLKRDFPDAYGQQWTILANSMNEMATRRIRTALLILVGAVGFVLLIACANIANLLLARAASRTREVAVRAAVGATRTDLIRQLLAESLLLSIVGAVVGLGIAYGAVSAVVATVPVDLVRVEAIQIDGTVLLFTLAVAVVTGLLFGIAPAIHASHTDLHDALKDGARTAGESRGQWLRRSLVVAEVALALTLLVGAGLLIRSFAMLQGVAPGFDPRNLITVNLSLPRAKYPTPESRAAFFENLRLRLVELPGVESVGATSTIPFGGSWSTGSFNVEGYQAPEGQPGPWGDQRLVTPGFHEAMKIKLLKGRLIAPTDRNGAPKVVVVDDEMVRRYWPNTDPIGKRITFNDDMTAADVEWITVIGVVEHTAHEGLDAERRVQLYGPALQRPTSQMTFALRSQGDPTQLVTSVRQAVLNIDPDQPIAQIRTMDAMMDEALGQRKLTMYLLGTFAGLALLLSAIGIYGVMSFDVTRRSQEIGVRMALGAARSSVLSLVMKQGVGLALVGVAIGLAGAFALTRVLEAQLFGITRTDPATFASVALALTLVATMATLIPALRATRLDPVRALRCE
jgi:putative ABC transport system permease protein